MASRPNVIRPNLKRKLKRNPSIKKITARAIANLKISDIAISFAQFDVFFLFNNADTKK